MLSAVLRNISTKFRARQHISKILLNYIIISLFMLYISHISLFFFIYYLYIYFFILFINNYIARIEVINK